MRVERISSWVPVPDEIEEDRSHFQAMIDYYVSGEVGRPLTLRERITGRRFWTGANGTALEFRVGWRWMVHRVLHPRLWRSR